MQWFAQLAATSAAEREAAVASAEQTRRKRADFMVAVVGGGTKVGGTWRWPNLADFAVAG